MEKEVLILIAMAMCLYFMVLWAHSLRFRFGLGHFYATIGAITAVMSWVTDIGLKTEVSGITFYVGSTVFYTSLLLSVFVIYVFNGPRNMRIAISTVAVVSALIPITAAALHFQSGFIENSTFAIGYVPVPSFRINLSSIFATIVDMIFLAMAWEFLGKPVFKVPLWLRTFLTLIGVMMLDVVLFATLAFGSDSSYLSIVKGTMISRAIISVFAFPFLYGYLHFQSKKKGEYIESRPVFAILKKVDEIKSELHRAHKEIARRKEAEKERDKVIEELKTALSEVKTLRGLIPICANCKNIRDDGGYWKEIESYIREHSDARFTHGICPNCREKLYPNVTKRFN